jgi:hypothetical protein
MVVSSLLVAAALALQSSTGTPPEGSAPSGSGGGRPGAGPARPSGPPLDWRSLEAGTLEGHVQLTFADRFVKAGEAYFSPDDRRIVFQAVERPKDGGEPDPFYAMYVGDVVRDADGAITSLANIVRVSPAGSANTCGWFDPTDPNTILFASTIGAPSEGDAPGYQRGTGRYRWMFPPEMRIVLGDLKKIGAGVDPKDAILPILGDGTAYVAEGSISPDGRWILYCDLSQGQGDLWLLHRESDRRIPLVQAPGYDGGPFFSPDGKRICYRSDRTGTNLLQIYVADLAFDANGMITGIEREHQVTRDGHVNWCPFFHPSGRFLVFASSAVGHMNYEVFAVDAGVVDRDGTPQSRYGTNLRRVTSADGADVLPVFSHDGRWLLWTGQRDAERSSQLWIARWTMPEDPKSQPPGGSRGGEGRSAGAQPLGR